MSKPERKKTPALLPWIPPGKPTIDETFNKFAHKKNSKIDGLELGHSNAAEVLSGQAEADAKGKKDSSNEGAFARLRNRIRGIFDEGGDKKKPKDQLDAAEERRKSNAGDNARNGRGAAGDEATESEGEMNDSDDDDFDSEEDGEATEQNGKKKRSKGNKKQTDGALNSEGPEASGSRSGQMANGQTSNGQMQNNQMPNGQIPNGQMPNGQNDPNQQNGQNGGPGQFYGQGPNGYWDYRNMPPGQGYGPNGELGPGNGYGPGFGPNGPNGGYASNAGYGPNGELGPNNGYGPGFGPNGPNGAHGSNGTYGYNVTTYGQNYGYGPGFGPNGPTAGGYVSNGGGSIRQGYSVNGDAESGYFNVPHGFTTVNLDRRQNRQSKGGAPEAWIIYPKDEPRAYTSRPVNLASSVGSMLKESFSNINAARVTPAQAAPEPAEDKAEARRRKRRTALIAGAITSVAMLLFLIILVAGTVALTNNGGGSAAPSKGGTAYTGNSTGPCNDYSSLTDAWRRITTTSTSSGLHCDQPSAGNKGLPEAWYRFQGSAGQFLPTAAPGSDGTKTVCGTNIVAWLNGQHPKVSEGIVDRQLCFQWATGPCQYSVHTSVRTCEDPDSGGTFYVYRLKAPADITCNYAFCAAQ